MHRVQTIRAAVVAFILTLGSLSAQLGPGVDSLQKEIQSKSPTEVRNLIIARFGPPTREVGSGLQIEQWDVDGGVLTFHPLTGATFKKAGVVTRLIHTNNPVGLCLFGNYEMTTLPAANGTRYWLGNVVLSNETYAFNDSRDNLDHRQNQAKNFFMLHPKGRVLVRYSESVTATTRLEDLPQGTTVARVTFVAGQFKQTYRIITNPTEMSLAFEADGAPFLLGRAWVDYWR